MQNEGNQTQTVQAYVRHKHVKEEKKPVRTGDKAFAVGTLIYFIIVLAKYQPVLFSALVLSIGAGFAYKYWSDHRVVVVNDLVGEPMPEPKAKRRYRKKSDYMDVYRDGKLEASIYRGNA